MNFLAGFIQNNSQIQAVFLPMAIFLFIFLFIWVIILHLKIRKIKESNRLLFAGKKITNLEEVLISQVKELRSLDKEIQELYSISNQINGLAFRSVHKVGLVRFNPFKDVGGDQSFSLAMLNGKNNGLVLSSLFTREGARLYAKTITEGESLKHPLTEEEKKVLQMAMEGERNFQQRKKSSKKNNLA